MHAIVAPVVGLDNISILCTTEQYNMYNSKDTKNATMFTVYDLWLGLGFRVVIKNKVIQERLGYFHCSHAKKRDCFTPLH